MLKSVVIFVQTHLLNIYTDQCSALNTVITNPSIEEWIIVAVRVLKFGQAYE